MFKSNAQRGAFFAALQKKKAGMDGFPTIQKPMKLEKIDSQMPKALEPIKLPNFLKLKKIMKVK